MLENKYIDSIYSLIEVISENMTVKEICESRKNIIDDENILSNLATKIINESNKTSSGSDGGSPDCLSNSGSSMVYTGNDFGSNCLPCDGFY